LVSRRQLIRGVLSDHRVKPFPPWSINEQRFVDLCSRCDDCIKACPQHILVKNDQGFPVVDFSLAACTFCAQCSDVCKTQALSLVEFLGEEPWRVKARPAFF